jgi:hypothetical protein
MQMKEGQAELIVVNSNATNAMASSCCNKDDEMKLLASPIVVALANKQKRAIHFRPKVKVHNIPRLVDLMLLVPPETLWYQKSDYANFKTENSLMIQQQMILQGTTTTTAIDYCERGLEFEFKLTCSQREHRRKRLLDSLLVVLDEQELQREEQHQDATFLAELYNDITAESQQLARRQGLQDEQVAREIHSTAADGDAQKKQACADSNKAFSPEDKMKV